MASNYLLDVTADVFENILEILPFRVSRTFRYSDKLLTTGSSGLVNVINVIELSTPRAYKPAVRYAPHTEPPPPRTSNALY